MKLCHDIHSSLPFARWKLAREHRRGSVAREQRDAQFSSTRLHQLSDELALSSGPRRGTTSVTLALLLLSAVGMAQCGGSNTSPTSPGSGGSGITLSVSTMAAGSSGQGTISLTTPLATAASVALSSSNAAVATVPAAVTIAASASSGTFTITSLAAGTTTITASLNGGSSVSATLTVTGQRLALASISLGASSVVGGTTVTGTASLTAAAPAGGADVTLSATDPLTVPASVTVPAGLTSATFAVLTRTVGGTVTGTVSGSYGGGSASTTLSVTKPTAATASFGVTGPTETDTCTLTNDGNTLNCTFDGTTSVAPGTIVEWDWTFRVAATFAQTTSGPKLTMPGVNCSLVPPPPLPIDSNPWFSMAVSLKVHDNLGNVSAEVTDNGVRLLLPRGMCGY